MNLTRLAFPPSARRERAAFTLIELLVVIAIIIILIALIFPAISGVRERGNVVTCLSNMKQLALASFNFAVDHDGNLPTNESGSGNGYSGTSWVVGSNPKADPANVVKGDGIDSISGQISGASNAGCLWPYVRDLRVYICPSFPQPNSPPYYVRSYSMADVVEGYGANRGRTLDNSWSTAVSAPDSGNWVTIRKMSDCRNPSQVFFIMEENPPGYPPNDGRAGINDGYFRGDNYSDRPATYHLCGSKPGTGKSNVVFLDGHGQTMTVYPAKSTTNPVDEVWALYQKYPQLK